MFPTATTPDQAWPKLKAVMAQIRSEAVQLRTASASGPVGANGVISYLGQLADEIDQLATLAAVPGIAAYAQAQTGNSGLDIVAEYNATKATITALPARTGVREWIIDNFPKDGGGNLLEKKFDANGRIVLNTFSSASLANLRTQLDVLIATIAP